VNAIHWVLTLVNYREHLDSRIADDQLIFPLKESWQKKNQDMKFAVKERPFGESVKDAGVNDELKRMQYKLQVIVYLEVNSW